MRSKLENICEILWIFIACQKYGESIGKNVSINLSIKYSQKLFDDVKQSTTNELKTALIAAIQKQQKQLVI